MKKKLEHVFLQVDGGKIALDNCDGFPKYFLGSLEICGKSFHVEAVEVKVGVDGDVTAVNEDFQDRIDSWLDRNDSCLPQTVALKGKDYFINIEHFAA